LAAITSFWYDEPVIYTHEQWRGRIRACNGVIAIRDEGRIAAFDQALARLLEDRFGDPLEVVHRVFVMSARA
jgi:hypothetical protein